MCWKEDYISLNFKSQEIFLFVNDKGDEIEMEVVQFHDHYWATATICPEEPSRKEYFAEAKDQYSKRNAARKALMDLYRQVYYPRIQFVLDKKVH